MDIPDLTPMNEAAARALFAEDAAQRAERYALQAEPRKYSAEQTAELMAASRKLANQNWDLPDSVDPMTKTFYRERALAVSLASWQPLAEQVWDHCAQVFGVGSDHIRASIEANPYRKDA